MKKTGLISIYYLILTGFVFYNALNCVVKVSKNIDYGQKIAKLEQEKETLSKERNQLEIEYSQKISLYKNELLTIDSNYTSISKPIALSVHNAVALR